VGLSCPTRLRSIAFNTIHQTSSLENNKPSTSNEFPPFFMELKSPLPRSRQPTNCPYREPVNFNIHSMCLITVLIVFFLYTLLLQAVSSLRVFWLKFCSNYVKFSLQKLYIFHFHSCLPVGTNTFFSSLVQVCPLPSNPLNDRYTMGQLSQGAWSTRNMHLFIYLFIYL
jgi:hypothetical protein